MDNYYKEPLEPSREFIEPLTKFEKKLLKPLNDKNIKVGSLAKLTSGVDVKILRIYKCILGSTVKIDVQMYSSSGYGRIIKHLNPNQFA